MSKTKPHTDKAVLTTKSYSAFELLGMVERARPTDVQTGKWQVDVMISIEGWHFELFYGCGNLSHIDHFVTPEGVKLEVWPRNGGNMNDWQKVVSEWGGVGDLELLKEQYSDAFIEK